MNSLLKPLLKSKAVQYIFASLISIYLKFVSATTVWTVLNTDKVPQSDGLIIISWHNRVLLSKKLWASRKEVHFIVSASKDGTLLRIFLNKLGGIAHIGSSGAGTGLSAMKSALKILIKGKVFCIAPDGSRGPRYTMKPGVSFLMKKTGVPCLLSTYNVKRRIVLNSWDNLIIPLPFNRGVIMFDLIQYDKNLSDDKLTKKIEKSLINLSQSSDKYFNHTPIEKV